MNLHIFIDFRGCVHCARCAFCDVTSTEVDMTKKKSRSLLIFTKNAMKSEQIFKFSVPLRMKIRFLGFLIEETEENGREPDEDSCNSKWKIKMNYVIVCFGTWENGELRERKKERERETTPNAITQKKTNHKKRKNERKREKRKHQQHP